MRPGWVIRLFFQAIHIPILFSLSPAVESGSCSGDPAPGSKGRASCKIGRGRRDLGTAPSFESTTLASEKPYELLQSFLSDVRAGKDGVGLNGAGRGAACPKCSETWACCGGCGCYHGTCSNDTCVCDSDWFGDACDTNPLMHASFLPEVHPHEGGSRRARNAASFARRALALVRDLDALQHGHTCVMEVSTCSVQVVVSESKGLGAWVHHLSGALTSGLEEKRTTVVRFPYDYFFHDGCVFLCCRGQKGRLERERDRQRRQSERNR